MENLLQGLFLISGAAADQLKLLIYMKNLYLCMKVGG